MQKTALSKIRLLYVEDDKSIRDELAELLEGECLELLVVNDGEVGLAKFREFKPDMILTDISMPMMDGITMCKLIRKEDDEIPIIISSAFSNSEYLLEAIEIGIGDYLMKPIKLNKLFNILEKKADGVIIKRTLKENEKLLSQYKDVVDAGSIVSKTDVKGVITYVNDAFVEISGYTKEELIGKKHNMVRDPSMPAEAFREMWKTVLAKKRWNGIIRNRAKDGSVYIVDSTIIPIVNIDNQIEEFISIRTDITQIELQKEGLTNDLHTSTKFIEEFQRAIKNNTIFCRTSLDGLITMSSEKFNSLLEYEDGELEGLDYTILIESKEQKYMNQDIAKKIENGEVWQGMLTHKSKNGNCIYLESSYIPIVGVDGKVLELFCFFTDISETIELNAEIIATQREVISTMGAIGETRSKETGAHVKRVAEYSKLLALKVGLSSDKAEELKMASPMHDIGKVAIPDSILNKPGKLTFDEFEIMKTHAELGYEMLRHSKQKLLRSAAIVASEHHEKWDGSGYPNKKSGEDIHIFGRITAIADVFDALGHDRVYKKAWPLENILSLFKDERGKHFDPNLIDIFMNNLDDFMAIKNQFDEEMH